MRIHVRKLNEYKDSNFDLEKWFDAVKNNDIDLIKDYIEKGIDVNIQDKNNNTALIWASDYGHLEVVQELLSRLDIDVNTRDNGGNTALIYASYNGHFKVVQELLNHSIIDVNVKNKMGESALSCVIKLNYYEIEELLRAKGAVR